MRKVEAFLLLMLAMAAAGYGQSLAPETVGKLKAATVYLKITHQSPLSDEDILSTGTGFFVGRRGLVLTSYHVVSSDIRGMGLALPAPVKEIAVVRGSGSKQFAVLPARILAVDKENDLALLAAGTDADTPFLDLAAVSNLVENSAAWVFGYPFGEMFAIIQQGPEITINRGFISALRHDDTGNLKGIQIDASINPGSSGGPVVNENGKVMGIMCSVLLGSHTAFAVPAQLAARLIGAAPAAAAATNPVAVAVACNPADAALFVNNHPAAAGPGGRINLVPGWHTLRVARAGFEDWFTELTLTGPTNLAVTLRPCRDLPLIASGGLTNAASDPKMAPTGRIDEALASLALNAPTNKAAFLMWEDFDNQARFEQWEQSTGGNERRTWFLEKGALHQFESDEFLHAIYFGNTNWDNYVMQTDIRIADKHDDSRAGLIFRENETGFYLLRFHKETGKVQLAYHCKRPFGWLILREHPLDTKLSNQWVTATVCVAGDRIACFLDRRPLFAARADFAARGRAGFYSVESKASFANLRIFPAAPLPALPTNPVVSPPLRAFWFQDNFQPTDNWWQQYSDKDQAPDPWSFTEGGCAQMALDDRIRSSEFTRYRLADFQMELRVLFGEAASNSQFGVFLRKTDKDRLLLRVTSADRKIRLIHEHGNTSKILKEKDLPEQFFKSGQYLQLVADKNALALRNVEGVLLDIKGAALPLEPGRFGFLVSNLRVVFNEMRVSSLPNERNPPPGK
jgi:hypothetical protein